MTENNPNPEDSIESEPFEMGPESVEYPPVLRLTANPPRTSPCAICERLQEWQDSETIPHVSNFQDPGALRKLLSTRRIELLRSIIDDPPESIRALADRLN